MTFHSIDFLTFEFAVLSNYVGPLTTFIYDVFDDLHNVLWGCTNLCCRVTFAEGDGVVFDSLKVDGDTEWGTEFVVSSIATTDGLRRVVYFVGDTMTAEFSCYKLVRLVGSITKIADDWGKVGMIGEWHKKTFGRCDEGWEGENLS
jgi:hypothetical protein